MKSSMSGTYRESKLLTAEDDIGIVNKVLAGDTSRFEMLMRRYNNRLFRVARGLLNDHDEAMDVVQDSWVTAYQSLSSFKGPDGFGSWVSKIAHNNALMRLRKNQRIEYMADVEGEIAVYSDNDAREPVDDIAQQQMGIVLEQAIQNLPLRYRSVFVMRAVQELDTRETADSLELQESAVKQRYLRAKRMLKDQLLSQIEDAGVSIWEFDGERCDRIVSNVFARIGVE